MLPLTDFERDIERKAKLSERKRIIKIINDNSIGGIVKEKDILESLTPKSKEECPFNHCLNCKRCCTGLYQTKGLCPDCFVEEPKLPEKIMCNSSFPELLELYEKINEILDYLKSKE